MLTWRCRIRALASIHPQFDRVNGARSSLTIGWRVRRLLSQAKLQPYICRHEMISDRLFTIVGTAACSGVNMSRSQLRRVV